MLIEDTQRDPNFRMHQASRASPGIGSFIGVPIVLADGRFYGTLCAVDPAPQRLTLQQAELLVVLGRIIATQIERDHELSVRRQAEAEQSRLYQAEQQAVREREALLAIASHELKNPLAALLGYAHVLQRRMQKNPDTSDRDHQALKTIVAQAERLDRMLTDLLDVSRMDNGQFVIEQSPVDLSTLLHQAFEEARPAAPQHRIAVEDADLPIIVNGDAERLLQVFRNLLNNAVKYSPAGGPIDIRIEYGPSQAHVSIRDEGIGIPDSALPSLFHRFYRAPNGVARSINGFGIGLYVVREIVTRHGGTISLTSAEGVGTTFTVSLPRLL